MPIAARNRRECSPWFKVKALHHHSIDIMRYYCGDSDGSGTDGIATQRVLTAAVRSIETGAIATVELADTKHAAHD